MSVLRILETQYRASYILQSHTLASFYNYKIHQTLNLVTNANIDEPFQIHIHTYDNTYYGNVHNKSKS